MAQKTQQLTSESDLNKLLPASREVELVEGLTVRVYELTLAEIAEVIGDLEQLVNGLVKQEQTNFTDLVRQYPQAAFTAAAAVTRSEKAVWETAAAARVARALKAGFEVNQDFFAQCLDLMELTGLKVAPKAGGLRPQTP